MTREEKDLLRRDLCARLPYEVKAQVTQVPIGLSKDETLTYNSMYTFNESDEYITIKPYLRPMSSMTEEERNEMSSTISPQGSAIYYNEYIGIPLTHLAQQIPYAYIARVIDWLNAHHFDYRGLIEKGLAIAVTEDDNPYKD